MFLSLLLQCKFANSTLLSLLSFSYFITPYDAQASSAFRALIFLSWLFMVICINDTVIRVAYGVIHFFILRNHVLCIFVTVSI